MAQTVASFDTHHQSAIHDGQLDYYGKRLATASSDSTIRIWDLSSETPAYLAELLGHEGPVWQVAWAHPKFGSMLASCSYDMRAIIWTEQQQQMVGSRPVGSWHKVYCSEVHSASVNAVAWAPWEFGLHFATASTDGTVCVTSHQPANNSWTVKSFKAHLNGVTSVTWGDAAAAATVLMRGAGGGGGGGAAPPRTQRLVTGGCDNQVRIWRLDEHSSSSAEWVEEFHLTEPSHHHHNGWVRDVSWRPNVGVPSNTIASCGDDQQVVVWVQEEEGLPWKFAQSLQMKEPVCKVAWSVTGTVLAVASGSSQVSLFKENLDGRWEKVTNLTE
eukprot:GHVS01075422.1.p1 GENE.GHVS01075422.1~~GHVS01075422.1.p1  ORF type:complete len:329 (-),score=87.15 GHVS01075422.1:865-1851(-)